MDCLDCRLSVWVKYAFDGIGHEFGEMLQSLQPVGDSFGMCLFVS